MDRIEEFNERLEDIVGIKTANDIIVDAQQLAYGQARQYGLQPQSTESQLLLYQNILDGVLSHYEIKKRDGE